MDQVALVGNLVDDGRRLVEHLVADGYEVLAAAWLKLSEEGRWVLYIASPVVDVRGLRYGLEKIHASLTKIGADALFTSGINLVGSHHPVAVQLLDIYGHRPGRGAMTFIGPRLGDVSIDEAYIYRPPPSPVPGGHAMTTDEVLRKVTELMNRPGVAQSATVALRNNTSFQGIPFGLEKNNNVLTLKFIETGSGYIRSVPASDVSSVT